MTRWVADAAPLILLAKAGHLSLLTQLADEILLPTAVVREIRRGPRDDPARQAIEAGFGTRLSYVRPPAAVIALGMLGAGERAMLSVGRKFGPCTVLVDDRDSGDRIPAAGVHENPTSSEGSGRLLARRGARRGSPRHLVVLLARYQ